MTADNAAEYKRYVESLISSLDVIIDCGRIADASINVRIDISVDDNDDENNTYMVALLDDHLKSSSRHYYTLTKDFNFQRKHY